MFQICFRCENRLIYTGSFCHLYGSVKKLNVDRQGISSISTVLGRKQVFSFDDLYTVCFLSVSKAISYSAHLKHPCLDHILDISLIFHCNVFKVSVCVSRNIHLEVLYFTGFFFCVLFSCPYLVVVGKRDVACIQNNY